MLSSYTRKWGRTRDDDDSEETEDSDVQGDEAPEDDARTKDMQRGRINEDLMTTAESSPSRQDDDADEIAPPPAAAKSSIGFFFTEDDLDLLVSTFLSRPISFNSPKICSCFQAALTMTMKSLSQRGLNIFWKN
jgi:hypothetical protein